MFKNEEPIIAKNGKFSFSDLGDAYKEAITLTFIAVETVSADYAIKQMYPDKKMYKYLLDDLSKEMLKLQKKVLDRANNFVNFVDTTFQFEYKDGEVRRIESKFFTEEIDKYAYVINKMFEYILILKCKYNVPDEFIIKLGDSAKKINKVMHSNTLECQIYDLITEVEIQIKDGKGIIGGKQFGLIIVLYALQELINNVDLDKSKPTTLVFNTKNDKLFIHASGNKKILNNIIDNTIIRVKSNLNEKVNNDSYNKELGHILYKIFKNSIEKRAKRRGE